MLLTSDEMIVPSGRLQALCKDALCAPESTPSDSDRTMLQSFPQHLEGSSRELSERSRRVRFVEDGHNMVRILQEEDEEDIRNSWLQQQDYLAIRHDNLLTLLAVKEADGCLSQLDADTICPRGLEVVLCKLLFGINHGNQKKVPKLIVQLYRSQQKLGTVDPKEICSMYEILSQYDRSRAIQAAVHDACLA